MNPRERVIRAIEFKKPDRIPLLHEVIVSALMKYGQELINIFREYPDDFGHSYEVIPRSERRGSKYKNCRVDDWGCVWEEVTEGMMGQVKGYPLKDWDDLKNYKFPTPLLNKEEFRRKREEIKKKKEKWYVIGYRKPETPGHEGGFTLFQRLFWLRGMENLMVDLGEDREEIHFLADKVLNYNLEGIHQALMLGVDGILFADDWGTQNSLMISPALWRKFFKPRYQKMFALVHQAKAHVFFHSDGYTMDIIQDLLDIGADVLNPQFSCMNLKELSQKTKGKVCILTDIDRQHILPLGTPEQVKNYVREIIKLFGTPQGGIIGMGEIGPDVPLANIRAMFSAFREYDGYI